MFLNKWEIEVPKEPEEVMDCEGDVDIDEE